MPVTAMTTPTSVMISSLDHDDSVGGGSLTSDVVGSGVGAA